MGWLVLRFILLLLLIAGVVAVVLFNQPISIFSDTYLTQQKAQKAIQSGDLDRAIGIYSEASRHYSDNADLQLALAKAYEQKESWEQAEETYRQLLSKQPSHLAGSIGYAKLINRGFGQQNEALQVLKRTMYHHRSEPAILIQLGNTYKKAALNPAETRPAMQAWLYRWALYYFRNAVKLAPDNYEARFGLGVAYQGPKKRTRAAQEYCNALLIDPKRHEARYNLGLILVEMNQIEEGYRQLTGSVELLARTKREQAQQLAETVAQIKGRYYNGSRGKPIRIDLNRQCLVIP